MEIPDCKSNAAPCWGIILIYRLTCCKSILKEKLLSSALSFSIRIGLEPLNTRFAYFWIYITSQNVHFFP
jgi:hypothetical protein